MLDVSGGVEAILQSVNRVLTKRHVDGSLTIFTVDFSNVFNIVDRSAILREVEKRCPSISLWIEFLYAQAARLYLRDGHITSAIRVQQGDSLRSLLLLMCYTHSFIMLETILSFLFMSNILMMELLYEIHRRWLKPLT